MKNKNKGFSNLLFDLIFVVLPQNPLHPSNHFMTGWVRRLVEVDHSRVDVRLQVTFQRRTTGGNWREMTSPDEDCKRCNQLKLLTRAIYELIEARIPMSSARIQVKCERTLVIILQ